MKNISRSICAIGTVLSACVANSCVNSDYDLSKPIDTTIGLNLNVGIPGGSSEFISIDEIFDQETDNIIKVDENGDYFLELIEPGEPVSYDFRLPEVEIDRFESEPTIIMLPFAENIPGGGSGNLPAYNMTFDVNPNTAVMDIEINSALPAEIKDVRNVKLTADISFKLSIMTGAATVLKGFTIDFPEFITVAKRSQSQTWTVKTVDGHQQIYFNSDDRILASAPLLLDLSVTEIDVTKAPAGQGVVGGSLRIYDKIHLGGKLNLNTADFSSVPSDLSANTTISLTDIVVDKVTASLNPEHVNFNVADKEIFIGDEVPDFLLDETTCLDFYNPLIKLDMTNELPFSLNVAANVRAFGATSQLAQVEINGINVPGNISRMPFYISAKGGFASQDGKDVVIPELPELIKTIPEKFSFTDIQIKPDDDYRTIEVNRNLSCSLLYSAYAPMAFGKDFKLVYDLPIEGLGVVFNPSVPENQERQENPENQEIDANGFPIIIERLDKWYIKFQLVNSIPFELGVSAEAIDIDGQPIPSDKLSLTFTGGVSSMKVASGLPEKPSDNAVEIMAVCHDSSVLKKWDKINLKIVGEVSQETVGVQLNSLQGLQIKNLTGRFDGGASITF